MNATRSFWRPTSRKALFRNLHITPQVNTSSPQEKSSHQRSSQRSSLSWIHKTSTLRQSLKVTTLQFSRTSPHHPKECVQSLRELVRDNTRRAALERKLASHNVSHAEFLRWRNSLVAPNLEEAVRRLTLSDQGDAEWQRNGWSSTVLNISEEAPAGLLPQVGRPPLWLVLNLIANKVNSPQDANLALALSTSQVMHAPGEVQLQLLLLSLHAIVKFEVVSAIRYAVSLFLSLPSVQPNIADFNKVLDAIARMNPSTESRVQVLRILQTMRERSIGLDKQTYRILLKRGVITLAMGRRLRAEMSQHGVSVREGHLGSLLAMAAREGQVEESGKYLDEIRDLRMSRNTSKPIPVGSSSNEDEPFGSITSFNTTYLSSFKYARDPAVVFSYFDRLRKAISLSASDTNPRRRGYSADRKLRDWTTLLSIAAYHPAITSDQLSSVFHQIQEGQFFRLNTTSYTALVSGFLRKNDPTSALQVWEDQLQKRQLDKHAIAVGIAVLAENGRLLEAFQLMDGRALKKTHVAGKTSGKICIDTAVVNVLMDKLNRAGRADVVFHLWETMFREYGVRPDAYTLSILLDTASFASRLDQADGVKDVLHILGFRNPFKAVNGDRANGRLVQTVAEMLDGRKQRNMAEIGRWNGMPAWENARAIFREVVLGNWPELWAVRSPAVAGDDGFAGLFFPNRESNDPASVPSISTPSPDIIPALGRFSHLVPSAITFHAYIALLSAHSCASEIPLALAWMRALQIKPQRRTLLLALVQFSEISASAPIVASWSGEGTGEYAKLRRWLQEWLGDHCPSETDVAKARMRS